MEDNQLEKQDIDETILIAIILALFFPPLGVAIKAGLGVSFLINVILTFLGFIPGVVHALYIILRKK